MLRQLVPERGDTLIEVLIAAFVLALIVGATFTGLEGSTRAAALGRARSQAQALAEQDEERLRGDSIQALVTLSEASTGESRTVTENGTKFTITSTVKAKEEETSVSCTSGTPSVNDFLTVSEVEWRPSPPHEEKIKESSLIARPPGVNLIVQINGAAGTGVAGMSVTSTQKSTGKSETGATDASGCKLFTSTLEGGTYDINVAQTNYVDQNWYRELKEDPKAQTERNLVSGVTTRASFEFEKAGQLAVKLLTGDSTELGISSSWPGQALNVLASESSHMNPTYRTLRISNSEPRTEFSSVEEQAGVFPRTYTVYPGGCTGNSPALYGSTASTATVTAGNTTTATLTEQALVVDVYKGTAGNTELLTAEAPKVVIKEKTTAGEGCTERTFDPTTLPFKPAGEPTEYPTAARGALRFPGLPFGRYSVCLEHAGMHYRRSADETELGGGTKAAKVKLYWGEATESGSC